MRQVPRNVTIIISPCVRKLMDGKEEGFPKWAAEEISKANFEFAGNHSYSGYPLEIDRKNGNMDVQFYERLPQDRYIVTLAVPDKAVLDEVELGQIYKFEFKVYEAKLSEGLVSLLREKYQVSMNVIHRFELISVEKIEC